jgi:hypothetical protein
MPLAFVKKGPVKIFTPEKLGDETAGLLLLTSEPIIVRTPVPLFNTPNVFVFPPVPPVTIPVIVTVPVLLFKTP